MTDKLYHDPDRNVLVYATDRPQEIVDNVPGAQRLNGFPFVEVPNCLRSIQALRRLDLPVLAPMAGYDWPIVLGRTPCAHQKTTANFMVAHPRSFVLSDPGTMKTLSALWAADYVMQDYEVKGEKCRALILAPLSILRDAWETEILRNFLDRRTGKVLLGSKDKRLAILDQPADFYIINYDGLSVGSSRQPLRLGGVAQRIHDRPDIKIVIVDEARNYHDGQTYRHRLARMAFADRPYLWLLTGTPTSNGPLDAYGQAKLVNGARGISFTGWKAATLTQVSRFKWVPARGAAEKVKWMLSPSIRFALEEIWDGPEMVTQTRTVPLTAEQTRHMRDLKNGFVMQMQSGERITAVNEAAVRTKMLQVAQGAVYDANHDWHPVDAEPRRRELEAVLAQAPGKVLCFIPLTSVIRLVYGWLHKDYNTEIINGQTPAGERQRIIREFQEKPDGCRVILADPGSLSLGVNLFAARSVIWYGPTDKTEQYLQGNKRAHRPGQKYPVSVLRFVATALEREIYRRLEANESLQGVVLKLIEEGRL